MFPGRKFFRAIKIFGLDKIDKWYIPTTNINFWSQVSPLVKKNFGRMKFDKDVLKRRNATSTEENFFLPSEQIYLFCRAKFDSCQWNILVADFYQDFFVEVENFFAEQSWWFLYEMITMKK